MDFHLPEIKEVYGFLIQYPVLAVLLGGIVFGAGLTQIVKKIYLAYMPVASSPVSNARYKATTRLLSCLSTFLFSHWLWDTFLTHQIGDTALCAGVGVLSPLVYDGVRAVISWKFPEFAKRWGSDLNDDPSKL